MPEADVLIIGGGIAGASTAYYLAQQGHQVTLLERGAVACEASGVNAGGLGGAGWGNYPDLQAFLTMGSFELFKTIQIDLGYPIEFRQSGRLQAIHTDEQYEYLRDKVLRLRSQGCTVELLSPREALAVEPESNPALLGFMYSPDRGQADPVKATRAFASLAQRSGARILTSHEVTALRSLGARSWNVTASGREFQAGVLVLAAGAWCGPLGAMLGLHIPIVPVRGQMWSTPSVPPCLFHTISSTESDLCWDGEHKQRDQGNAGAPPPDLTHGADTRLTRHLYGRQTRSGEVIFGGDRQLVGFKRVPEAAGIEVNREQAGEVIPMLRRLPIEQTWAGLMPFSLDGTPLIGKVPQLDNLYIVGGLASSGFGRGPMAGKLVADYIHTGHRPQVLEESDPARCVATL
ncbi:MAG: FAD-dependent oxidoreductase [Dehalococcoidia bacterium]|nr:FAD-dependent oxidoreductase [Dehalococcoidia bacterium]